MSDFLAEWTPDHRWLRELMRDEVFAYAEFASVGGADDDACGIGWMIDENETWSAAADPRNGAQRCTVAASQTLRIQVGTPGAADGLTSGQRSPVMVIRWIPVQPGANLQSQRWGFLAKAAGSFPGVYIESGTTGHPFLVAEAPTTGVRVTVDLGVAPSVMTEYRLSTPDGGFTYILEQNGALVAAVPHNNVGATTTLVPLLQVVSDAGGSNAFDIDMLFFRAARSAAFVTQPKRFTAADLERRLMRRCLLGWAEFCALRNTAAGSAGMWDHDVAGTAAIQVGGTGGVINPLRAGADLYIGSQRIVAGVASLAPCAAPEQNPEIWAAALLRNPSGWSAGAATLLGWFDASANGAYFRVRQSDQHLHCVTSNGGTETITDLGLISISDPNYRRHRVLTEDGGGTWRFYRGDVLVAQHGTNCPATNTPLAYGAAMLTAANATIGIDTIMATCDRVR